MTEAKKTKLNNEAMKVKVWGRFSSSNTQKVLWMLHEIGKQFELEFASARLGPNSQYLCTHTGLKPFGITDSEEYRKMSPLGQIPVLQDGELTLCESHTIVRYLASEYAPHLHLNSVRGMATCSSWMDWVLAENFNMGANHHWVDQLARTPPEARDPSLILEMYHEYVRRLDVAEKRLSETHAFMTGEHFTVADIPIAAEVTRWHCGLHNWSNWSKVPGSTAPTMPSMPAYSNLNRFFQKLQERPAFVQGCLEPEREHFGLHISVERETDIKRPRVVDKLQPLFGQLTSPL